jgi:hypothetical protein
LSIDPNPDEFPSSQHPVPLTTEIPRTGSVITPPLFEVARIH